MDNLKLDDNNVFERLTNAIDDELNIARKQCLAYHHNTNKLYCMTCALFSELRTPLASHGYTLKDFRNSSIFLRRHENGPFHQKAYNEFTQSQSKLLYENASEPINSAMKLVEDNLFNIVNDKTNQSDNFQFTHEEIKKNRHIVERIVMCVILMITIGNFPLYLSHSSIRHVKHIPFSHLLVYLK